MRSGGRTDRRATGFECADDVPAEVRKRFTLMEKKIASTAGQMSRYGGGHLCRKGEKTEEERRVREVAVTTVCVRDFETEMVNVLC